MAISQKSAHNFSPEVRKEGHTLFVRSRVKISRAQKEEVNSSILGLNSYRVTLKWSALNYRKVISAKCNCPAYAKNSFCSHIWATILGLNNISFGLESTAMKRVNIVRPEQITNQKTSSSNSIGIDTLKIINAAKQLRSGYTNKTLTDLSRMFDDDKTVTKKNKKPPLEKSNIWYEVSVKDNKFSNSKINKELVINFYKQGMKTQLSDENSFKKFNCSLTTIDEASQNEDKEILTLLASIKSASLIALSSAAKKTIKNYQIKIPENLITILIEKMNSTGRLFYSNNTSEITKKIPLLYSREEWKFYPKVTRTEYHWEIEGSFVFGNQKINYNRATPLLRPGFLIIDDKIANLNIIQFFPLLQYIEQNGTIRVPLDKINELRDFVKNNIGIQNIDLPKEFGIKKKYIDPIPVLKIELGIIKKVSIHASILFRYADEEHEADSNKELKNNIKSNTFKVKNKYKEQEYIKNIFSIDGIKQAEKKYEVEIALEYFEKIANTLIEEKWLIMAKNATKDNLKVNIAKDLRLAISSEEDWFNLKSKLDFECESYSIPEIVQRIHDDGPYIILKNGSIGIVPSKWLNSMQLINSISDSAHNKDLLIHKSQLGILEGKDIDSSLITADKNYFELKEQLKNAKFDKSITVPKTFKATLREYQKEGLSWLKFLQDTSFSGCLADDMGLGKTIQVLALLEERFRDDSIENDSLLVVPKSLISNWVDEIKKFTKSIDYKIYFGNNRDLSKKKGKNKQTFIITTYGVLRRDINKLKKIKFDYIILDEAQAIKNDLSQTNSAACQLNSSHKLALTGTPIENNIGELFSLFKFLQPYIFGNKIKKNNFNNPDLRPLILQSIRPFILRRTKEQVLKDLPPKSEKILFCEMEPEQEKIYNDLANYYRVNLDEELNDDQFNKSKIQVLEALLRLRQAACHPAMLEKSKHHISQSYTSAKLEALLVNVKKVIANGHKALVFSQFTSFLDVVKQELDQNDINYAYIDGQTNNRKREIEKFKNDSNCQLFLISIKAGGFGLNLTEASYSFILDPWWNPAVESQAVDRMYRIGQKQSVFSYRLITRNTVEEKILKLQKRKKMLADELLTIDGSFLKEMTPDDFRFLIS